MQSPSRRRARRSRSRPLGWTVRISSRIRTTPHGGASECFANTSRTCAYKSSANSRLLASSIVTPSFCDLRILFRTLPLTEAQISSSDGRRSKSSPATASARSRSPGRPPRAALSSSSRLELHQLRLPRSVAQARQETWRSLLARRGDRVHQVPPRPARCDRLALPPGCRRALRVAAHVLIVAHGQPAGSSHPSC
jgi:hypothetical protein